MVSHLFWLFKDTAICNAFKCYLNAFITGQLTRTLKYNLGIPVILHGSVERSKVPQSEKRLHNKGQLILATELLKSFSPGVFSRLCVTHSKNNNNGNLEPKSELIIFFFFKEILKAEIVNSES